MGNFGATYDVPKFKITQKYEIKKKLQTSALTPLH